MISNPALHIILKVTSMISTWWHHQVGHAGCCVSPDSSGSFHPRRCHQSGRYKPFDGASVPSAPLCLPGRAAAPLSYSSRNMRTHNSLRSITHMTVMYIYNLTHTCDRLTMLLSSLRASSTMSLFGLCFCFRMAVEKSSPFGLPNKTHIMTLSHAACTHSSNFLMWHWAVFRLSLTLHIATEYVKTYENMLLSDQ